MPHVDARGAKLYFEESGDGYPIIFLHEFRQDLRQWEGQVRCLSRTYRCVAYNGRGYLPSDIAEDPTLYGWEFSVDDIAAVMRGLSIERAHLVGLSMGGYAALQFGLQYPEKVSAIVVAAVGSDSLPSQRDAWLKETSILSRIFIEHGMRSMAERMARGPGRIQLKYKDRKTWQDFVDRLRGHSARGLSNTMARCQALRPSLHDLRHQLSGMAIPMLFAVGDEDMPCLETNLMLKSSHPNAGLWICPNTGHAINLEEPAAFNTHLESFFSAVEPGGPRVDLVWSALVVPVGRTDFVRFFACPANLQNMTGAADIDLWLCAALPEREITMNVIALSQRQFGLNLDLLAAMFRLRRRVFKDRLDWTVSVSGDLELDVYDALNPTYLVLVSSEREVTGCVRLLPTTGPTMLVDTFPQLLMGHEPPRSSRVLESSRFCVDTSLAAEAAGSGLSRATFILFAAMIESLGLLDADSIVTVTDTRMERILRRAGWPLERLAAPQRIGQTMALAGFLHGSRETLATMYRQAGVEGPVLLEPESVSTGS